MIDIFIPVIWICINANCEFMAPHVHYTSKVKCMQSIDEQKKYMQNMVTKAGQGKINIFEGTCVSTSIENVKGHA
jgi:hypothetical protein